MTPTSASDPHRDQPVLQVGCPLHQASGAVLLLHGRGAPAEDILGLAEAFNDPRLTYLAPQAAGFVWYPQSFLAPRAENEPGVSSALSKLASVVAQVTAAGVPLTRIAICGFSQGACLSSEFVATHPARYGALIAYTGGLIGPPSRFSAEARAHLPYFGDLAGTPAFLGSGDPDPHVPWSRVEASATILRQMGASVTTQRYPGRPHTISADEIALGRQMILAMLA